MYQYGFWVRQVDSCRSSHFQGREATGWEVAEVAPDRVEPTEPEAPVTAPGTVEPADDPVEPTVLPTDDPVELTVPPTWLPVDETVEPTVPPTALPTVEVTEPTVEPTVPLTVAIVEPMVEPAPVTTPPTVPGRLATVPGRLATVPPTQETVWVTVPTTSAGRVVTVVDGTHAVGLEPEAPGGAAVWLALELAAGRLPKMEPDVPEAPELAGPPPPRLVPVPFWPVPGADALAPLVPTGRVPLAAPALPLAGPLLPADAATVVPDPAGTPEPVTAPDAEAWESPPPALRAAAEPIVARPTNPVPRMPRLVPNNPRRSFGDPNRSAGMALLFPYSVYVIGRSRGDMDS